MTHPVTKITTAVNSLFKDDTSNQLRLVPPKNHMSSLTVRLGRGIRRCHLHLVRRSLKRTMVTSTASLELI